jgi:hypothetical protein
MKVFFQTQEELGKSYIKSNLFYYIKKFVSFYSKIGFIIENVAQTWLWQRVTLKHAHKYF